MQTIAISLILISLAGLFIVYAVDIIRQVDEQTQHSRNKRLREFLHFFSPVITVLPVIILATLAGFSSQPDLGLGALLGVNIAAVTLMIGLVVVKYQGISVVADFLYKDIRQAVLALLFPFVLAIDGNLSRMDGILLILMFIFYQITLFQRFYRYHHEIHYSPIRSLGKWLHRPKIVNKREGSSWLVFALIVLLFAVNILFDTSKTLVINLSFPALWWGIVGLGVVMILPQLWFELEAASEKQPALVLGDLLSGLVINFSLGIGVLSLLQPMQNLWHKLLFSEAFLAFVLGFFMLWVFARTKYKLSRLEGLVLVFVYIFFIVISFSVV